MPPPGQTPLQRTRVDQAEPDAAQGDDRADFPRPLLGRVNRRAAHAKLVGKGPQRWPAARAAVRDDEQEMRVDSSGWGGFHRP